MKATIEVSIYL